MGFFVILHSLSMCLFSFHIQLLLSCFATFYNFHPFFSLQGLALCTSMRTCVLQKRKQRQILTVIFLFRNFRFFFLIGNTKMKRKDDFIDAFVCIKAHC